MSAAATSSKGENTGRWSKEEHAIFMEGLRTHGKEWKTIAQMVETRTVVQIRTHAQKYFQKLAKMGVTDPIADITNGHLRQKLTGSKRRRGPARPKPSPRSPRSPRSPAARRTSAAAAPPVSFGAGSGSGSGAGTPATGGTQAPSHGSHITPQFGKSSGSAPPPALAMSFPSDPEPSEFESTLGPAQLLGSHLSTTLASPALMLDEAEARSTRTTARHTTSGSAFVAIPSLSDYVGIKRSYGLDPLSDSLSFPEGSPTGVTENLLPFPTVPDDGRISPVAPLADLMQTDPLDGWLSEDSCGTSQSVSSAPSRVVREPAMKRRRTMLPPPGAFSSRGYEFDADTFVAGLLQ